MKLIPFIKQSSKFHHAEKMDLESIKSRGSSGSEKIFYSAIIELVVKFWVIEIVRSLITMIHSENKISVFSDKKISYQPENLTRDIL